MRALLTSITVVSDSGISMSVSLEESAVRSLSIDIKSWFPFGLLVLCEHRGHTH